MPKYDILKFQILTLYLFESLKFYLFFNMFHFEKILKLNTIILKSLLIMNEKSKFQCNLLQRIKLIAFFCSLSLALMAQPRTISGVVNSSEDGQALMGATVKVKGTNTGTITDRNGKFNISIPNDESVLVISMIGLKKTEVKVGKSSVINITLDPDQALIDEVVSADDAPAAYKRLAADSSKSPVGVLIQYSAGRSSHCRSGSSPSTRSRQGPASRYEYPQPSCPRTPPPPQAEAGNSQS